MSSDSNDGTEMTLDGWLKKIRQPGPRRGFIDYQFPTQNQRDEYLSSIRDRSDDEVRHLLRQFLIPSGSIGIDRRHLAYLVTQVKKTGELPKWEYQRRLLRWGISGGKVVPPWEGITWVLDLLPYEPRRALNVLDAYFAAHCQILPDGRMQGLSDARAVIRAKYILSGDVDNADKVLNTIEWRELEVLSATLFQSMGYRVKLTPPRSDGGRDVIATRQQRGMRERCLVQCKRYTKPVGPGDVRELLGVVAHEKANKGTLVTTSRFTSGAKQFAKQNRMELIGRRALVQLLNEYHGSTWPLHISSLLDERLLRS